MGDVSASNSGAKPGFDFDWNEKAKHYDAATPGSLAIPHFLSLINSHFDSCKNLSVLDAGCGTAETSLLLARRLESVDMSLFDGSEGMLTVAKEKFEKHGINVQIKSGHLPTLPFGDNSMDIIMCNYCLHHVGDHEENKAPGEPSSFDLTLAEFYRVLKPGGLLLISELTPTQFNAWYFALFNQELVNKHRQHFIGVKTYKDVLKSAGFQYFEAYAPLHAMFYDEKHYYNYEGYLDKEWREKYTFWKGLAHHQPGIDDGAVDKLKQLIDSGEIHQFVEKHDAFRYETGSCVLMHATK